MQILYQIDAVAPDFGIKEGERGIDMRHHVTAIIDNHIRRSKLIHDACQELRVGLVPNADFNLVFCEFLAPP